MRLWRAVMSLSQGHLWRRLWWMRRRMLG
uniref:Uncharacterized protein n=1 Tax=Arundo donax TaxID=35708 RepID=A0A0A9EP33_ARUDO